MLKWNAAVHAEVPIEIVKISKQHVWLKDSDGIVHKISEGEVLRLDVRITCDVR